MRAIVRAYAIPMEGNLMIIKVLKIVALILIVVFVLAYIGTLDAENEFALNTTSDDSGASASNADAKIYLLCIEGATDASTDCNKTKKATAIKKATYYVCDDIDIDEIDIIDEDVCTKKSKGDEPEDDKSADATDEVTPEATESAKDDPDAEGATNPTPTPTTDFGNYPKDNEAAAEMFGGDAINWYKVGSNGWGFRDLAGQVTVPAGWRLDYTGHSCEHMTEQGVYGATVMVPPSGAGTLWFVPGETGCGRGISA